MARKSAKKASPKRAHKAKRAENRPAAKAPKRAAPKAGARKAPARKAAPAKGKAKAKAGRRPAAAPRSRGLSPERKQEILATVARPRKGEHEDQERPLETEAHEHADTRLLAVQSGNPGAPGGHNTDFGAYKNKAVARLDRPQNWFRKAPKQPEK
jgi:hypothetical protein